MKRLANWVALLSLIATTLVGVFWWRHCKTYETYYIASKSGVLWAFTSDGSLGLLHANRWPGPTRSWRCAYDCRDNNVDPPADTLPCFITWQFGGSWSRRQDIWTASFYHGALCSPVHPSGEIWLGPNYPNQGQISTWPLSKPMPFWSVCLPHGFAFTLCITPAAVVYTRALYRRLRRCRRIRRSLCPECGYDLRFTPGRCPECGVVNDRSKVVDNPV